MCKSLLSSLPPYVLTGAVVLLILWLTLSPDPLGQNPPELFPGADKIAHALMFGFLTAIICLDRQRAHRWSPLSTHFLTAAALSSALFGALIEVAQYAMQLGRGFELLDILADTIGAFLAAFLWRWLQHLWSTKS